MLRERKILAGKNKMSVMNAVRNKLIHRVFAVVRDERSMLGSVHNRAKNSLKFIFLSHRKLLQILFVSGSALTYHKVLSAVYHRNHKYFPCSRIL